MTAIKTDSSVAAADKQTCPGCGSQGKAVEPVTLQSLLTDAAKARVAELNGFRFCSTPGCEVAYYRPGAATTFTIADVRVPIGQKQTDAWRKVCYCFDHTAADIDAEVAATGTSTIPADIAAKCKQGLDRCPETNPQGSCCLGNVKVALKTAQAKHGIHEGRREPATVAGGCCDDTVDTDTHECCGQPVATNSGEADSSKRGMLTTGGAVVTAIFSSACCWLPLLLIAFGASAAGVAGFFETYRPIFLGVTAVLLAGAFYLVYRKPRCAPGEACAVPNTRLQRFNKGMLWVATVIVIAFATFPNYIGALIGGGESNDGGTTIASTAAPDRTYSIEGMTCQACAANLQSQLAQLPGVARAEVSYADKTASVFFDTNNDQHPPDRRLLSAIADAGFKGQPVATNRPVYIKISGMTCEGCAAGLANRLKVLPGVKAATIDYGAKQATVVLPEDGSIQPVLDTIADEGFTGQVKYD